MYQYYIVLTSHEGAEVDCMPVCYDDVWGAWNEATKIAAENGWCAELWDCSEDTLIEIFG